MCNTARITTHPNTVLVALNICVKEKVEQELDISSTLLILVSIIYILSILKIIGVQQILPFKIEIHSVTTFINVIFSNF